MDSTKEVASQPSNPSSSHNRKPLVVSDDVISVREWITDPSLSESYAFHDFLTATNNPIFSAVPIYLAMKSTWLPLGRALQMTGSFLMMPGMFLMIGLLVLAGYIPEIPPP